MLKNNKGYSGIFPVAISLSLVWVCVLGVWQFVIGHSVGGLWIWLGERPLTLIMPKVAKISLFHYGLFLRAYSTFPHPNSLAGFLSVLALLLLSFKTKFNNLLLIICWLCLLVTFSRSGILITSVTLLYYTYYRRKPGFFVLLLGSLVFFLFLSLVLGNPASVMERYLLAGRAFGIIFKFPFFGSGLGTFPSLTNTLQPVHNLPLLLLSELGIPFFSVICYLSCRLLINSWKHLTIWAKLLILDILVLGLIDHYWLTSVQNLLLLALVIPWIIIKSDLHHHVKDI